MASNLSRKELRQDKFAVEVEHTVDFFAEHREKVIRYGGIALAIIVIVGIVWFFRGQQRSARQMELGQAMTLFTAPVGPPQSAGQSFPSEAAKNDAVVKAFNKVITDYSGSEEAYIAEFYLAGKDVENGKFDDARKKYQDVIDHANSNYASLAKLTLGQTEIAQNRPADASKLFKDLMDHPTDLVSKDEATIDYAKSIAATQPAEARKLLTPLASGTSDVKSFASAALADIPAK